MTECGSAAFAHSVPAVVVLLLVAVLAVAQAAEVPPATNCSQAISEQVPAAVLAALKEAASKEGFKIPCLNVTAGSGRRNGYFYTAYVAHIHDEDATGPGDLSVVCKLSVTSNPVPERLMKGVFAAEGILYSKVLPVLEAAAGPEAKPQTPRVLHLSVDGPPPYVIVLEDFRPLGFDNSKALIDAEHARVLVQQLAKFHAAGFVVKHLQPDRFAALTASLKNLVDPEDYKDASAPYVKAVEVIPGLLTERWPEGSEMHKLIRKACDAALQNIAILVEPWNNWEKDCEGCCLVHGDSETYNVAFKYDKATGNVTDSLLFDFHSVHYSSPAVDLVTSLLLFLEGETRRAHLDDLLLAYMRDLHAYMRAGGIEAPEGVFSWELLQKHLRRTALWAVIVTPLMHDELYCDDDDDEEEDDEEVQDPPTDVVVLAERDCTDNVTGVSPLLKGNLLGLLQDVEKHGWLPTEEEVGRWMAGEA